MTFNDNVKEIRYLSKLARCISDMCYVLSGELVLDLQPGGGGDQRVLLRGGVLHIYISTYLHVYISTYLHIYISTHPRVQVRYCGQECRDRHLPPDHEEPWPVVAKYRPGVGRLLVAARDIDPGELIFTEE